MGDYVNAFGGHAWNEVVVGGHWIPVDANWNESNINATHIQLKKTAELGAFKLWSRRRLLNVQWKE